MGQIFKDRLTVGRRIISLTLPLSNKTPYLRVNKIKIHITATADSQFYISSGLKNYLDVSHGHTKTLSLSANITNCVTVKAQSHPTYLSITSSQRLTITSQCVDCLSNDVVLN